MCGICGVFNYAGTSFEVTEELITGMRQTMVHRGPDDAGVYVSPDRKVGLGHRRLSIIDLSPAGRQPMCNEDGTVWIVYNGEIYNHQQLRRDLEARGHVYKSHTDTETILHLYEEKGIDCLHDLDGMFALAIWDSNKKLMFLARDRIGKKPLYYASQDGQLIFGSEIKAILEHPQIRRDIDTTALYHYLTFFVTPSPMTLFSGISKLAPGHLMTCRMGGDIEEKQYWDAINYSDSEEHSEEYYVERIRELLTKSVEKRMMSDVPFGVFLSGGIDSSTNVALMAGLMDRPVDTFSVGFKDQPLYNEFNYAQQVATEFGTNHHQVIIDQRDLLDYIPKLVYSQDEPIADWVCVPLYFVSRLAREHGTSVIQIGEGSDEIFFGYDGFMTYLNIYKYWKPYMKMPGMLRKAVSALAASLLPPLARGRGVPNMLHRAASGDEPFWGGAIAFTEADKQLFLSDATDWNETNSSSVVGQILARIDSQKPEADFMQRMIYLELKHRLPELLLMRVDKITMSTSVEGRAPYLDHHLVEFAMSIPSRLKIKDGHLKYILKKAVEGVIPDNIIYRPKQGFSVPLKEWYSGELGDYIRDSILGSGIKKRQFFDYGYIERMLRQQHENKRDSSTRLWCLFNLCKWYDFWIEGQSA